MEFNKYDLRLKDEVAFFTKELFYALFDDVCNKRAASLKEKFTTILKRLNVTEEVKIWEQYSTSFCTIREKLDLDAEAFESSDPACKSLAEVYLAYPGFHAIAIHRLSHELYKMNIPILPRMISEYGHGLTGTDIHPGAVIGDSFFIDHATGIIIGETTVIKDHVKIFQGVTLGGLQVKKELASVKRHPTIENNVIIYANATILGGEVTIGEGSIIGANVCITDTVSPGSIVTFESENTITTRKSYVN